MSHRPNLLFKGFASLLLVSVLLVAGCDFLEVENPNNLVQEDIDDVSSATALKNGVLNATMDALSWALAPLSSTSDELSWIGSYESYRDYETGNLVNVNNEITVNTFPELSEARFLADNAITKLSEFEAAEDEEERLGDPSLLTKVYLYSALIRVTIGVTYDDFVFSFEREASPAIGAENMVQVFDEAIDHAGQAVSRARESGSDDLLMQALGMRARAKHARAVWQKLNPPDAVPAEPLVDAAGAAEDARAALALMPADYKAQFDYLSPLIDNYLAGQVNARQELAFGEVHDDPKTGEDDPRILDVIQTFTDTEQFTENYSPITWLSAREMRLLIAEAAAAEGNAPEARAALNALRARYDLPPVEPGDDLARFIEHERYANLFLQGRRLNDMYRFGTTAEAWLPEADALTAPGTLLPIPSNELLANPNL